MADNIITPPPKRPLPEWNPQQAKLLKEWAEISSSYRWLHNQTHMMYKTKNLRYMIPLIIMSTVTGTANFAQATFPSSVRPYVPQIIGAINLFAAILTTIYQFLKISEYMESHRITSINYGKFSRNISVELALPVKDRSIGGRELVKISRLEIDRLIEQSPSIPKHLLKEYEVKFGDKGITSPEIINIKKVEIFIDEENKLSNTMVEAGLKFKQAMKKKPVSMFSMASLSPMKKIKEALNIDLGIVSSSKLVSGMFNNIPGIKGITKAPQNATVVVEINDSRNEKDPESLISRINAPDVLRIINEQEVMLPVIPIPIPLPVLPEPEEEEVLSEPVLPEPEPLPDSHSEEDAVLSEVISEVILSSNSTINDELIALRGNKLVSKKNNNME